MKNVIPPAVIEQVCAAYAQHVDHLINQLKDQGLVEDAGKELPFETCFAEVAGQHANKFGRGWRKELAGPAVFDLHHVPALVDIVAQIIGTDVIGHPVYNARPKLPHQQLTVVPWHQDSGYFGPQTEQSLILTCWVPLVPATVENGCMEVLKGSHRLGLVDHHTETREGQFLELGDDLIDETRAVTCPMEVGDVLLLHNLTFHRSLANISSTIRWSIDIRYVRDGDDPGSIYWPAPNDTWVIRSETRPATTLDDWLRMAGALPW